MMQAGCFHTDPDQSELSSQIRAVSKGCLITAGKSPAAFHIRFSDRMIYSSVIYLPGILSIYRLCLSGQIPPRVSLCDAEVRIRRYFAREMAT